MNEKKDIVAKDVLTTILNRVKMRNMITIMSLIMCIIALFLTVSQLAETSGYGWLTIQMVCTTFIMYKAVLQTMEYSKLKKAINILRQLKIANEIFKAEEGFGITEKAEAEKDE